MKPIIIYSWAWVLITLGAAYWAWNGLPPDLDKFPVHWGADGVPDRFGSKSEVLIALVAMPISVILTFSIFAILPKLEPIKKSVEPNARPYTMLWL